MSFYTDKWMIVEKSEKDIVLFRKSKNNVIMEKIVGDVEDSVKEDLCQDIFEEYDIDIEPSGDIYFLYQSQEMHLVLKIIKEDSIEEVKLTKEPIPEIFELNICVKDKKIHIVYSMMLREAGKYILYHHYYNGKAWDTFTPEEIEAKKFLNPIKIINEEDNISLVYINMNKNIMIKRFNTNKLEWEDSIKLIDTNKEKVFLDIIKIEDDYHFTYCEYVDESLVVKHEKHSYENGIYNKISEDVLSNDGAPSYPTPILYNNRLWVIWVELNKLVSRHYNNESKSWSRTYLWKESKNIDFLRYKYLTQEKSKNTVLNHSFGKAYPEVKFLGFGSTENTEIIPSKDIEIGEF